MTRTPYSRNLGLTAILLAAFAVSMILLDRYAAYLNYQTVPFDDARQHELARRLVAAAVRRDPSLGDDPMVLRIATVTRSFEQDVAHTLATLAMAPNLKQATAAEIFRALRAGNVAPAVAALTAMQQSGEAIAAGRAALLRLDDRAIALAAYRRIANLSPEPVYAWLKFGHRASHLQAYGDAFAAYERVLKETDIYADRLAAAEAMSGFALVARAQGDTNNAIAFQYEAIRLHEELARTDRKAIAFNHLGLIVDWACDTANVYDGSADRNGQWKPAGGGGGAPAGGRSRTVARPANGAGAGALRSRPNTCRRRRCRGRLHCLDRTRGRPFPRPIFGQSAGRGSADPALVWRPLAGCTRPGLGRRKPLQIGAQ